MVTCSIDKIKALEAARDTWMHIAESLYVRVVRLERELENVRREADEEMGSQLRYPPGREGHTP